MRTSQLFIELKRGLYILEVLGTDERNLHSWLSRSLLEIFSQQGSISFKENFIFADADVSLKLL